jgi:uncharacterized membrane protein
MTATETMNAPHEQQTLFFDDGTQTRLTKFLGWFSIGLGVAEVVAPRMIARISGTRDHGALIRAYGLREIAVGAGILTKQDPGPWLWARVAGDVVDLASLAGGSRRGGRIATAGAIAAVAGVTALDIISAQRETSPERAVPKAAHDTERAEASVVIRRSPDECYQYWRDEENFPRFVSEVRSVQRTGGKKSHWVAGFEGSTHTIEWDSETNEDPAQRRITWQTLPESRIYISGAATFEPAPGNRGTIVRVQMDFDHPGRTLTSPASRMLGKHPEQILYKSLRRLKQLLEVGEVITTEGQPAGRRGSTTWLDKIAR